MTTILAIDPSEKNLAWVYYYHGTLRYFGDSDPFPHAADIIVLEDYFLGPRKNMKKYLMAWHQLYFDAKDSTEDRLVVVSPRTWRAYWGIRSSDEDGNEIDKYEQTLPIVEKLEPDWEGFNEHECDAVLMARWYMETGGKRGMKHAK
jgi:hypothetical protein